MIAEGRFDTTLTFCIYCDMLTKHTCPYAPSGVVKGLGVYCTKCTTINPTGLLSRGRSRRASL